MIRDYFLGCTVRTHHKGSNSQAEQARADRISDEQLAIMQKQLGMVDPALQNIISNGGLTPQVEAAMRSVFLNSLPKQYQNLTGQLSNQLVQRGVTGGTNAGGGDIARQFGALGSAEAGQQATGLADIQLAKQGSLERALGMGLGLTNTFNTGGLEALGVGQRAGQAADESQSSFWGSLFGGLSSLGGSVAKAASGNN